MIDDDPLPLVIVGTGDHAHVILEALLAGGRIPSGFVEIDGAAPHGAHWCAMDTLGDLTSDLEWRNRLGAAAFVVGIGDNVIRAHAYERALRAELVPASVVHPTATLLRGCDIGAGSQICARAVVGVNAHVGINTIVNTAATVDHDNVLGDHSSVAPGAHLAGRVSVGSYTHVGIAASINEGIAVGTRCLVAAGAAVVTGVPDGVRVAGVPARPMENDR
ncbi:MAG TPA: NeuD/PglB/VioB family sugar acetyltransferase [Candidatus Limnocylindria bacterium]|nr:NeuD/PglB/VioB family sugar acetyltransferase [Candidatus Limnocylindria bacterium]